MTGEQASSREALMKLRGPEGGYAHAHAGLAAFWRQIERDVLTCPVSDDDQVMMGALDAWLAGGTSRALFLGQDAAHRTALLARWALSVTGRASAVVLFLPVSTCFGTSVQREIQAVLLGLYASSRSTWACTPRNPRELKAAIAEGLTHVGTVVSRSELGEDEDAEDPAVLLIVDGLDRTADAAPHEKVLYLDKTSASVRVLVSVRESAAPGDASTWRERLWWEQDDTTVFEPPATSKAAAEAVMNAREALESTGEQGRLAARAIDALSAVLAPVSRDDMTAALGLSAAAIQALEAAPLAARALVVIEPEATYRLRDDEVRERWATSVDTGAIEDAIVERGLSALAIGTLPESAKPGSVYLIEYVGAHLVRRRAARVDLMRLVAPEWLTMWMRRPGGLVGFATDARRARAAAEEGLYRATTEVERRACLHDLVWCAVVEGSLFAKEGSPSRQRDLDLPYRQPTVDLARPTGAARSRAEALCTFAGLLTGHEREEVNAWVEDARAALPEGPELRARPIPTVDWEPAALAQVDPDLARRLQARTGTDYEFTCLIDNNPRAACLILGPDETLAFARAAEDHWHGTMLAGIAPHLPDPLRRQVVAEAVDSFSLLRPDRDALPRLFACAPWMSEYDASQLLCGVLGNDSEDDLFGGPRGLTDLAPLLLRLGGLTAIFDAASTLVTVGAWLP